MGVIELLTLIGAALRLLGLLAWPWQIILLPEMITIVFYIDWILLQHCRWRRERRRRKR